MLFLLLSFFAAAKKRKDDKLEDLVAEMVRSDLQEERGSRPLAPRKSLTPREMRRRAQAFRLFDKMMKRKSEKKLVTKIFDELMEERGIKKVSMKPLEKQKRAVQLAAKKLSRRKRR